MAICTYEFSCEKWLNYIINEEKKIFLWTHLNFQKKKTTFHCKEHWFWFCFSGTIFRYKCARYNLISSLYNMLLVFTLKVTWVILCNSLLQGKYYSISFHIPLQGMTHIFLISSLRGIVIPMKGLNCEKINQNLQIWQTTLYSHLAGINEDLKLKLRWAKKNSERNF